MNSNRFSDFMDIRGQNHAKRALEVAAAGGHAILLTGCPDGEGDTLAFAFPSIIPDTVLHLLVPGSDISEGTLFLQNIGSWQVRDLTSIWHRIQDRQCIGTFQPCACGYFGHPTLDCGCNALAIAHYQQSKAPFLRCFDIHIEMPFLRAEDILNQRKEESSQSVLARVEQARNAQKQRYYEEGPLLNAHITTLSRIQDAACLDSIAERLLTAAIRQLALSSAAVLQILRVARTIADLAAGKSVDSTHLAEAIMYRRPRREYY